MVELGICIQECNGWTETVPANGSGYSFGIGLCGKTAAIDDKGGEDAGCY